jgi:putative oxidoreductase
VESRFLGFRNRYTFFTLYNGNILQRLFSTFADGWPGAGLLLLRLLSGGTLLYCGATSLMAATSPVLGFVGAAAGALLVAGLWTPVAGSVVVIVELWTAFVDPGNIWMPLALAVLGGSLAMIGPGAWSIDARLFGRKQIEPGL